MKKGVIIPDVSFEMKEKLRRVRSGMRSITPVG